MGKNTYGTSVAVTIFGESHGAAVGAVLDGIAPGIPVDPEWIRHQLSLRRPWGSISTGRRETDEFEILSGVFEGRTTGTPICIMIRNRDTRSKDYAATRALARPGHADYTAYEKYHGFEDYRGGGHFSGRITAGLVAAGAVALAALKGKGILVGTHIARCGGVADAEFLEMKAGGAALPGAGGRAGSAANDSPAGGKAPGSGNGQICTPSPRYSTAALPAESLPLCR